MKIAYIISAYKLPEQLVRLVLRLNCESVTFLIHVDRKTKASIYTKIQQSLQHLTNVFFLKRHNCYWGDFGHVQATLKGIQEPYTRKIDFDYVVLLTGQDYPLRSNVEIKDFFLKSAGKSYMSYLPLPKSSSTFELEYYAQEILPNYEDYLNHTHTYEKPEGAILALITESMTRYTQRHFHLFGWHICLPPLPQSYSPILRSMSTKLLLKIFPPREFIKGFQPYAGGSYWCLAKPIVEYIKNFTQNNSQFIDFFQTVKIPDELFFQTIVMNSPRDEQVINDSLRYVYWSKYNPSPKILEKTELNSMMQSNKLFARKFDVTQDEDILDSIDVLISV